MWRLLHLLAPALAAAVTVSQQPASQETTAAPRPHIVFVMADDFGYNNFGPHAKGQANAREVQTPTLDNLTAEGVLLERHYVFQFCSPSRCAFTTGRNPIHVNLLNDALGEYNLSDPVSGFSGIPRNMTAIATKLASVGYSTVATGKVHYMAWTETSFSQGLFAVHRPIPFPPPHPCSGMSGLRRSTTSLLAAVTSAA